MNRYYLGILCFVLFFSTTEAYAKCKVLNETINLGQYSSIGFTDTGINDARVKSGLNCANLSLGLLSTTYLKYKVMQLPKKLVSSQDSTNEIKIHFKDHKSNPIVEGSENNLTDTDLISLFNGLNGDLAFSITIAAGQEIAPGTYMNTDAATVLWYYAIPIASIGCESIGYDMSSGFVLQEGILNCDVSSWGEGEASSLQYQIIILPDCRISVSNINFGSAPFPSAFHPVETSLGIRCSVKTSYNVSLSDGHNMQNGQRRMKNATESHYLAYEIYKDSDKQRWGSQGEQRWPSSAASMNGNVLDGKTQQIYRYRAEIKDSDARPIATGIYTDNITVEVDF